MRKLAFGSLVTVLMAVTANRCKSLSVADVAVVNEFSS